jgi:hypothetical protein
LNRNVAGDPASCSQFGGTLRQLATRMRTTGRATHDAADRALDPEGPGRPDPVVLRSRRRVDLLDAAAAATAHEVDRVGAALQAHATDLAEAVADSRRITGRAQAAGLQVTDGELTAAWGVSGVADGSARAQQEALRRDLQDQLDAVTALVGQRRQRLTALLQDSHDVLARHATGLRR